MFLGIHKIFLYFPVQNQNYNQMNRAMTKNKTHPHDYNEPRNIMRRTLDVSWRAPYDH